MVELGAGLLIVAIFMIAGLLVYSALLLLTAAIASIEERTFGKAIFSTLAASFGTITVGFITGVIPFIGQLIAFAASLLLPVIFTQVIFNTTFTKALVAELLRFLIVLAFSALLFLISILFVGMSAVQGNLSEFINQYGGQLF